MPTMGKEWAEARRAARVEALRARLPEALGGGGDLTLEIGCGHGGFALAFARQGLFAEALEQHAAAAALDPQFWEAHNNAGITLARMGRMREALERFERAAAIAPDDPDVVRNLAQARAELAPPAGP